MKDRQGVCVGKVLFVKWLWLCRTLAKWFFPITAYVTVCVLCFYSLGVNFQTLLLLLLLAALLISETRDAMEEEIEDGLREE